MKLLTESLRKALLANHGRENQRPLVKLFYPAGAATWLISDIDPNDHDLAFGLCDLGMGYPELGYVSLSELESICGRFGLGIERDLHWKPRGSLAEYADAARDAQRIVELPIRETA